MLKARPLPASGGELLGVRVVRSADLMAMWSCGVSESGQRTGAGLTTYVRRCPPGLSRREKALHFGAQRC